ncbi:hypothetical protein ACXJJ3_32910 [Kribbella sp. WER1]
MQFPKQYEIEHGDVIAIDPKEILEEVRVEVYDAGENTQMDLYVRPVKARKIARAILKAANVAEGKPENEGLSALLNNPRPAFPALLIDDDGDTWDLDENGETYTCRDMNGSPYYTHRTYDDVKASWGIKTEAVNR